MSELGNEGLSSLGLSGNPEDGQSATSLDLINLISSPRRMCFRLYLSCRVTVQVAVQDSLVSQARCICTDSTHFICWSVLRFDLVPLYKPADTLHMRFAKRLLAFKVLTPRSHKRGIQLYQGPPRLHSVLVNGSGK